MNKGKRFVFKAGAVSVSLALVTTAMGTAVSAASKPQVKILENWSNVDYNTYPVATFLKQATGFDLHYDMLPQDGTAAQNKLNLIMSQGTDYDLVETNKQEMFYFAQNGALTDLTPLIDKYGPNINKAISKDGFKSATLNGKIYAIPTKDVSYVGTGILIRADWLKKLNLKMPRTVNEFVNMLQQFKDQDPGGNGDQNIPFTLSSTNAFAGNLSGAYGMYNAWNVHNGKLAYELEDPRAKEFLNFMHSLYQKGLLDNEFATNQSATTDQKFTDGRAGAYATGWWAIPALVEALKKNDPNATIAYIPALTGPHGDIGYGVNQGYSNDYVMPKGAAHPEDAIKFVNKLLQPDVFKEMYIGKEGVDYKVVKGKYVPIQPAFFDDRGYASTFTIGMDEKHFYNYWLARVQKDANMYKGFQQLNNIPAKEKVPDVTGLAPYFVDLANDSQNLSNITNDFGVQAVVNGVTDQSLASARSKWEAAGGKSITKELNDWYAKFSK